MKNVYRPDQWQLTSGYLESYVERPQEADRPALQHQVFVCVTVLDPGMRRWIPLVIFRPKPGLDGTDRTQGVKCDINCPGAHWHAEAVHETTVYILLRDGTVSEIRSWMPLAMCRLEPESDGTDEF